MQRRPGGELAARPLYFFWLADCSGSMSVDGKIQALNNAVREAIPHMRDASDENPNAQVLVQCLKFSHGATWHTPNPVRVHDFTWTDLVADPLQTAKVDIVFLLDTSGSMSDEIEAVKSSCVAFADRIVHDGANVRLGLVGFDIGGHRGSNAHSYQVHNLSTYTIGVWPPSPPEVFRKNVQSLTLGLFGGGGCYLANQDTVDIFPHVVRAFDGPAENIRMLVIVSDEMGNTAGLDQIVARLSEAQIKAYVLGVPGTGGAHELIASRTGGEFWPITQSKGSHDFSTLLQSVAGVIAGEITKTLVDGRLSAGTDLGNALEKVADQLKSPPMPDRGLPPVLVLVSDGQPTDDFEKGLRELLGQPWGMKSVRIAIAIGRDADLGVLQQFIGHPELHPLRANNPEELVRMIRWASTVPLKAASAPPVNPAGRVAVPAPPPPQASGPRGAADVW